VEGRKAENIVYWENLGIRMIGKANIQPFQNKYNSIEKGYDLIIKGLEFRYSRSNIPEINYNDYMKYKQSISGWTVLDLQDKVLR
jgi:hypothetical protein